MQNFVLCTTASATGQGAYWVAALLGKQLDETLAALLVHPRGELLTGVWAGTAQYCWKHLNQNCAAFQPPLATCLCAA